MKLGRHDPAPLSNLSLPVRECGLKSPESVIFIDEVGVTPCAGVWIEIGYETSLDEAGKGHSLCGSVD